jgi:hypothetical protein
MAVGTVEVVNEVPGRADPLIAEPADAEFFSEEMDYPSHIRTWNRFIHMGKWFILHLIFIGISLYFFLVASQHLAGIVFLAIAVFLLGYGIVTLGRVGPEPHPDPENEIVPGDLAPHGAA